MRQPILVQLALLTLCSTATAEPLFVTSDNCIACHNGLTTPTGRDVSFGYNWRPSMMANAARDPYWQAAVRRETLDHPEASAAIQTECSTCHMPMIRHQSEPSGKGKVFANLSHGVSPKKLLALDGVSCSLCHQISPKKLGSRKSFTGRFIVEGGKRHVFGPYDVEGGLDRVMRSATGLEPRKGKHLQQAEACASCHTLFTHTLGPGGKVLGTLPEQVPFLEWKHSDYREAQSCQDCHMPVVEAKVPIAGVLGQPRAGLSRHVFRGGNFFMPGVFNRYRAELGVQALPQELGASTRRATAHLQSSSARLQFIGVRGDGDTLEAELDVTNLAGHKLPTAYPSRRVWLHLTVRDGAGSVVFESGEVGQDGSIRGNDNDKDGTRFEPHHNVIDRPDKVQIYEVIMVDRQNKVTTGLLHGLKYVKDNRLLPEGFDKSSASSDVAVRGAAFSDKDFTAPGDRVRYRVSIRGKKGPFRVDAELVYQPIGHRWAENLNDYKAAEPTRFVRYYRSMSATSSLVLTSANASWTPPPTSAPVK